MTVKMKDKILFASGSARIGKEVLRPMRLAKRLHCLDEVCDILGPRGYRNVTQFAKTIRLELRVWASPSVRLKLLWLGAGFPNRHLHILHTMFM